MANDLDNGRRRLPKAAPVLRPAPLWAALLAALLSGGCGPQGQGTEPSAQAVAPASEPAPAPAPASPAQDRRPQGQAAAAAAPAPSPAGIRHQRAVAETRKAVDETRTLMNEATEALRSGRPDLAQASLAELKARRDRLPDFLKVQVDRLDAVARTGISTEPQASLKAAIMASQPR